MQFDFAAPWVQVCEMNGFRLVRSGRPAAYSVVSPSWEVVWQEPKGHRTRKWTRKTDAIDALRQHANV